ncbi:MAG TPA: lysine--tRNA ligase [Candidatus Aminicenantes bacterium]|nr:lysine--tRNA ligase [Candidatus Aminicenantes bacterium]
MDDLFTARKEKLQKLVELGVDPYPYSFERNESFSGLIARFGDTPAEELEKVTEVFRLAGRIVGLREMGKSAFLHLFDGVTRLQIYVRKDKVGDRGFQIYKLLDIGDHVGVSGTLFRTRTGELTLLVGELTFLSKSFHPLPEKWHGLQDKELRYRLRFLDLIDSEETRRIFRIRIGVMKSIRRFFDQRGYSEVETPMMHPIPGGASARPFVTHHNALDIDLYLRVAPELYLKRLMVGGMEKIYEINRNFRNEGISINHNPEFTMIEFYELYHDYHHYIALTEELLAGLAAEFLSDGVMRWQGKEIPIQPPFRQVPFMGAIIEGSGIAAEDLWDEERLKGWIARHHPAVEMPPTFGKMLELMFDEYVEPGLQQPTFVIDYPKAISPLAKSHRHDARLTERFEFFIAGMEIANGFSELNDPIDQRQRFEAQVQDRAKGDDEALWIDQNFLFALEHGMAPAAGEGLGIDRLVMLLSGAASIKEVILFPQLKPER